MPSFVQPLGSWGLFPEAPVGASDLAIGTHGVGGVDESAMADVARERHDASAIRFDSTFSIGAPFANVSVVGSYLLGVPSWHLHPQFLGTSTCEALGRCDATAGQRVGSACKGGLGYCYTSAANTLECGRVISTQSYHLGAPVVSTVAGSVRACPPGTPNTRGGATGTLIPASRMPIAGCMLTADANYEPSADVHVPQMCAAPASYLPGCLFPGALNYNAAAREPAECTYVTRGCMTPGALNYNAHATVHDAAACIAAVSGCTLAEGVLSTDAAANVLAGCVAIVEGCMDPLAANYDAAATQQLTTICIPRVAGCMNPRALTYSASATVSNHTLCTYGIALPPSPPSPSPPTPVQSPGAVAVHVVRASVQLSGDLASLEADKVPIVNAFNVAAGTSFAPADAYFEAVAASRRARQLSQQEATELLAAPEVAPSRLPRLLPRRLQAGEYLLVMEQVVATAEAAAAAAADIETAAVTVDSFTAALASAGVTSATVLSAPIASAVVVVYPAPSPPPLTASSDDPPIIIIAAGGGGCLLLLIAGGLLLYRRHRMQKVRVVAA